MDPIQGQNNSHKYSLRIKNKLCSISEIYFLWVVLYFISENINSSYNPSDPDRFKYLITSLLNPSTYPPKST